jgi:hypothetical protein
MSLGVIPTHEPAWCGLLFKSLCLGFQGFSSISPRIFWDGLLTIMLLHPTTLLQWGFERFHSNVIAQETTLEELKQIMLYLDEDLHAYFLLKSTRRM